MRALPDMLQSLATLLPPWAVAVLVGAVGALMLPGWLYSMRVKQMKGRLRRAGRAGSAALRQHLLGEALDIAGHDGRRLVALAEEAIRLNQPAAWRPALERLEALDHDARDITRLREKVSAERPRYRHPLEAAVAVDRLLEQGMREEAARRLAEARASFPEDPDLRALEGRVTRVDGEAAPG